MTRTESSRTESSRPESSRPESSRTASAPPIHIRTMELRDLSKVYELGEELFTAEKWPALYRTWDEYEIVEFFGGDGDFCLVAVMEPQDEQQQGSAAAEDDEDEAEEIVVGFCLGTLLEKRHSAWSYGYLVWMGVDASLKGRGIGRKLLDHLTNLFVEHGARMMLVDTAANNEGALKFFRGQGFGHELEHVYLSRNLDKHPRAVKRRAKRTAPDASRTRRQGARTVRTPAEIVTPAIQDPTLLDSSANDAPVV